MFQDSLGSYKATNFWKIFYEHTALFQNAKGADKNFVLLKDQNILLLTITPILWNLFSLTDTYKEC